MLALPRQARAPVAAIVAVAITLYLAFRLDTGVRSVVQGHRTAIGDWVARIGNFLGDGWVVFPFLTGALIVAAAMRRPALVKPVGRIWRSVVVASLIASALKSGIGRERPDSAVDRAAEFRPFDGHSRYKSFPSGHTTTAFAFAASLALEATSPLVRAGLYAAASLTGFARVNNDRHWLSDVIGGAALGSAIPLLLAWFRQRRPRAVQGPVDRGL